MPPSDEEYNAQIRVLVTDIAVSLGIALLDTFRGPVETATDRTTIIHRWRDLASNICALGEYNDNPA